MSSILNDNLWFNSSSKRDATMLNSVDQAVQSVTLTSGFKMAKEERIKHENLVLLMLFIWIMNIENILTSN